MAVGARAERLRGSTKTITAPRHHCALHRPLPQPHQATRFPHARLIAPAVCAASDSGSPDALNVGGAQPALAGWHTACAPHLRPPPGRARRLLLGRLGARCALWRQLRAGGSSPTCSPALPHADLTRARCSRRAGPVRGPSKRPWAGRASTDPATDRLCRWCLSAASRSSAFCLRPPVSCRFAPSQRRFSGLPMVWIDQVWPK